MSMEGTPATGLQSLTTISIGFNNALDEGISVVEIASPHRITGGAGPVENLSGIEIEETPRPVCLHLPNPIVVANAWPILVCGWIHEHKR